MGNIAAKCFEDIPEERTNDRNPNQVASNISYNDITLPQIQQQQLSYQQQTTSDCTFCSNHFKLIHSEQFNLKNPHSQTRRSHQVQSEFNVEFTEPLAILHNDPIANYTSSWFQLALALPKYQKRRDHYEGKQEQMYFDQSKIPLLDGDSISLICLRWCIVDYFRGKFLQPQHQLLKQCCELFAYITHIAQFYQEIFLTNCKQQEYAYNIRLYVYLYHKFQKIMNYHNCKYEVLGDLIQNLYKEYFDFKNTEEIPHIKLIGYMMRIWCQTMLTEEVREILITSYRNFHWKNDFNLIYDYINSIIDANLNECNIHWIGHRDYFLFDNKMIDLNENPIEKFINDLQVENSQDFYKLVDKKLSEFQFAFPAWYFEVEFQELAIKHKIARLIKEVKNQKNQDLIKIKKGINTSSENKNSLNAILNTADTLFNQSQEEQSEYVMALLIQESNFSDLIPRSNIKRCPTPSTSDSVASGLKGNNSNVKAYSLSLKASEEAIQITKEVDVEQKKCFQIFQDQLKEVQMKIEKREFILRQRAENLKIKPCRQIEWFNYFQRMDLTKIPEQGMRLKECLKIILNELIKVDFNYYSPQHKKIEESI